MKKVGELHNIPIVEGDPNLLTKKQLLYKDGILSKRDSTGDIKNLGNNVQGGSGGEGGSVDSWVYYDLSSLGMNLSSGVTTAMSANFTLIKVRRSNGVIVIGNLYWITTNIETENYSSIQLVAVGIDEGMKCVNGDETITIGEYYKLMEAPYEQYPRLTKEEFYAV